MEKLSRTLTGLMLGLFTLLMAAALFLGTLRLDHKSYLVAFLLAVALFGGWRLWRGRHSAHSGALSKLGPRKCGVLLALLCFVVNLAWALTLRLEPEGDYATFYLSAVGLAENGTLRSAYVALFPHILGYSRFLSLFYRLFGPAPWVAPLINVLLTTLSGAALYALCLRWANLEAACFASLLWTLCPSKLLYNTMVLSEPFYTCLLLLFLLLIAELERRMEGENFPLWAGLLAGAIGGLLLRGINAARPIALVPLIAFGIWLLLLRGGKERDGRLWCRWLCFAAAMLVCYSLLGRAWNAYAARTLGEEPASVPGYSIYVGFNPQTNGSYSAEDSALLTDYYAQTGSAVQAQEQMLREAEARVRSGEISFRRLFAGKIRTLLGNDEGGAYYSEAALRPAQYWFWAVISNVYYYALVLTALLGTLRLWQTRRQESLLLAPLYVLGLSMAHMLVEVAGRYHYSIIPMLVLIAALAWGED